MAHKHKKTNGHRARGRWKVRNPGGVGHWSPPLRHPWKSRKKKRNRKRLHVVEMVPPIEPGPPVEHEGALTYAARLKAAKTVLGVP